MSHVFVLVEGQTEEGFVKDVLQPHLRDHGVAITPIIVSTGRSAQGHKQRGGGQWSHWHKELQRLLASAAMSDRWVTTMIDLYGLPGRFPSAMAIRVLAGGQAKVDLAEAEMAKTFAGLRGGERFIPYVQKHEFEALVLACLDELEPLLQRTDAAGISKLRRDLGNTPPEDVNDGPHTAPSKRLERRIPGYNKLKHAGSIFTDISVARLSEACPHFGQWVARLEAL